MMLAQASESLFPLCCVIVFHCVDTPSLFFHCNAQIAKNYIFKRLLTVGDSRERSEEQRNKGGRMIFFTFPVLYGFKVLNSGLFFIY